MSAPMSRSGRTARFYHTAPNLPSVRPELYVGVTLYPKLPVCLTDAGETSDALSVGIRQK